MSLEQRLKSIMNNLHNWATVALPGTNPFLAPELAVVCLCGILENPDHKLHGKFVTTSRIIHQASGKVVTRSGSHYTLMDVAPDYENNYPNARERLFKSLPSTP
jgi:hypothetical protein